MSKFTKQEILAWLILLVLAVLAALTHVGREIVGVVGVALLFLVGVTFVFVGMVWVVLFIRWFVVTLACSVIKLVLGADDCPWPTSPWDNSFF